jgi:carboxylesterase type B
LSAVCFVLRERDRLHPDAGGGVFIDLGIVDRPVIALQELAKKMATAWANFARTGNPSQPGLAWTPSDPVRCQTLVFDNHCRMVDDPEGEVRKILMS